MTAMWRPARQSAGLAYGFALVATIATLALRLALAPAADDPTPLMFMLPIAASAYWAGSGPGLVATLLSAVLSAYFLLPPLHNIEVARPLDDLRLAILVLTGVVISAFSGRLRRARRRAEDSERWLSLVLEAANDGVWDWSLETNEVRFSPRWLESLGYRPDEVAPRIEFWDGLVHSDDLGPMREARARHLRGETPRYEFVNRLRKQSGEYRWSAIRGKVVARAADGTPLRMVGTDTDITERREAIDALRRSEVQLQTVVENLTEGLVVSDERGQLLHWNRAGLAMHGYRSLEEGLLQLERFRDIFELSTLDGRVVPFEEWPLTRILRNEPLRDLDLRIRRLDVDWVRIFSYGGTIVYEPSGRRLAILTITDITGRTQAEQERHQLELQLRQTQKMESIGRLAGGVAHDFNNWLTVIAGCTELVADMLPPEPAAAQLIGEIQHASERAAALTRQLLAFSRQEVVEPRVIDLNLVVADAEKMLHRILGEDIVLGSSLDTTISQVRIDAGQWIQVLMNLAVNARDAMPQGGKLTIETREVTLDDSYAKLHPAVAPGRYVMLAVTDMGCGMSADVQARVFEPFFTTKPRGQGTGLGLAVVHGIVEQSGGHVGVYSEPGVGTTFRIYLPPAEAKAETVASPDPAERLRGTETILLVEDDDSVRRVTSKILRRYGYTVLEAASGEAALALLAQDADNVSLLITDVVMPNMDGRQLTERVQCQYPQIKALYTSGYTNDAVVRHGILHAEVAFLQKPHTSAMLLGKIREVLDRR